MIQGDVKRRIGISTVGSLRNKIVIQRPVVTGKNSLNEDVTEYQTFITAMANVQPLQGQENFSAKQTKIETIYRVTLRYVSGVTQEMRVLYNNRVLEIDAVINVNEENRELQIFCIDRGEVV